MNHHERLSFSFACENHLTSKIGYKNQRAHYSPIHVMPIAFVRKMFLTREKKQTTIAHIFYRSCGIVVVFFFIIQIMNISQPKYITPMVVLWDFVIVSIMHFFRFRFFCCVILFLASTSALVSYRSDLIYLFSF